jgi:hypothetical protein
MEKVRVRGRKHHNHRKKCAETSEKGERRVSKEFPRLAAKKHEGMCLTVVRVVGFVVQHKFVIDKVERVGSRLEGIGNHLVDELRW